MSRKCQQCRIRGSLILLYYEMVPFSFFFLSFKWCLLKSACVSMAKCPQMHLAGPQMAHLHSRMKSQDPALHVPARQRELITARAPAPGTWGTHTRVTCITGDRFPTGCWEDVELHRMASDLPRVSQLLLPEVGLSLCLQSQWPGLGFVTFVSLTWKPRVRDVFPFPSIWCPFNRSCACP